MTALIPSPEFIEFNNTRILAVMQDDEPHVAIKPICDALGLDWEAQRQRIARDEILNSTACMIKVVAEDGKSRQVVCLPLAMLNGWLFGIDDKRVKAEARAPLLHYKRECFKALHNHFFGSVAKPVKVKAHRRALPAPVSEQPYYSGPLPFEAGSNLPLDLVALFATANMWVKDGLAPDFGVAVEKALRERLNCNHDPDYRPQSRMLDWHGDRSRFKRAPKQRGNLNG